MKRILITGANAGLGKESAKQLATQPGVETIILGCRNPEKAKAAQQELEQLTGKRIFDVLIIDTSNLNSVNKAIETLDAPVDALVMNAGGIVGKQFNELTAAGVTQIFATNLLGHVALTEGLIKANKLTQVALYAGSEAARGVPEMGMKRPDLKQSSIEEFVTIANGSMFANETDSTKPYGLVKYMGALWMSSMARQYPSIRFVTMSPGGTMGTEGFNNLSPVRKVFMMSMMKMMLLLGKVHKVETGAKRFVDGVMNSRFESGHFYASKKGLTGPLMEQGELFADLNNEKIQENAKQAIYRFI